MDIGRLQHPLTIGEAELLWGQVIHVRVDSLSLVVFQVFELGHDAIDSLISGALQVNLRFGLGINVYTRYSNHIWILQLSLRL